jgi:hypothetical protein
LQSTITTFIPSCRKFWDLAEHTLGLVGRCGHRGSIGHIEPYCVHVLELAALAESGQCRIDVILTQVREHDLHSGFNKGPGNAEPNTARSPGDECCLALYNFHFTTPRRADRV